MKNSRSLFASSGIIVLLAMLGLAACAPAATPASPAQAPTVVPPVAATTAPAASTPAMVPGTAADAAVKVARIQGFGLFLTDNADRTLYAYANDTKDSSNCAGTCAQNWPPFIAHATPQAPSGINASLLTTFNRPDGMLQVEYDGHPLYYFVGDKSAGDVKGQGVGNQWHVLSPRGNPMMNAFSPSATATP